MTVQNLIDAIAEALFQEFGSNYDIYTEKVEQGLEEPCFLVRCVSPTKSVHLGGVYRRTNQFVVQYFPSTVEANAECADVLERLFECLENITLSGEIIHGTDLSGEITDGILNFKVNYDGFVLRKDALDAMGRFNLSQSVKG